MRTLVGALQLIVRHRRMLLAAAANDIRMRYAGSILGLFWLVLYPLLLLGTYATVYLFIFKVSIGLLKSDEYVALIFCGLIPFLGFSEALVMGVNCISSNANIVKNTLFPVELLPVKAVLTSQCTQLAGMAMLFVVLLFLGKIGPAAVLVLPVWVCQIGFSIGLAWILGSMNIFIRDLQAVISIGVMLLMMLSPIAYTPDMVPVAFRPLLALNPLSYFIAAYQNCLMLNTVPSLMNWIVLGALSASSFTLGHFVIRRLKLAFTENL